jgi:hypothetical protein
MLLLLLHCLLAAIVLRGCSFLPRLHGSQRPPQNHGVAPVQEQHAMPHVGIVHH